MRGEVTTQVVATLQRVAELTRFAEEVNSLRSRVAEARRHADEAERAFEALSARSWRDNKEVAKVRRSRMSCSRRTLRPSSGSLTF